MLDSTEVQDLYLPPLLSNIDGKFLIRHYHSEKYTLPHFFSHPFRAQDYNVHPQVGITNLAANSDGTDRSIDVIKSKKDGRLIFCGAMCWQILTRSTESTTKMIKSINFLLLVDVESSSSCTLSSL
jgi:hypothetical protein